VYEDIDRVLLDQDAIAAGVSRLAGEIRQAYADLPAGEEIVLMPILTGSIIFVADLMRELPQKMRLNVVTVSSYPGTSTESQGAAIRGALPDDLASRHVLIIDDILDSGSTIRLIRDQLARLHPASVRVCVLLRKDKAEAKRTPCEYIGFEIPDEFVVGYGLDYDNYYRNLPYIGTLKADAL